MTATLTSRAVLVRLSISLPGNSRKDAGITQDTIRQHQMGEKAGRWLKQIFPDEAIDPLVKVSGEIRTWHYDHTLPWSDEGQRILPTAMYDEYCAAMRQFRVRYESVRDQFLSRLSDWEEWARQAHNGTFDATLYLPGKLERKFGLALDFCPVPSSQDFRVQVDAQICADLDMRVIQAEQAAVSDLWRRLAEPLEAIAAKCKDENAIFRDTLIGNLRDICSLIPKLDVQQSPHLAACAALASGIAQLTPDSLRQDKATRRQTAAAAQEILAKMQSYGMGGGAA